MTVEVGTDALLQLSGREQAFRLDHGSFTVHPLWFDGIQPRRLHRQGTGQETDPVPALLDLAVVLPDPAPDGFTAMPRSVVPDQEQGGLAPCRQALTAVRQEGNGDGTDRTPIHKAQHEFVGGGQQQPIGSQGLGIGIITRDWLFDHPQRRLSPAMQRGPGQPAPPALIFKAECPVRMPLDEAHHFHNYPIPFVLLYYLMRINGLRLERLGHGKVKPFSYVLYALFYPAVAIDTRLRLIWRERKPPVRELNRELARWMLDRRVLTEDNLIVRAQKVLAQEILTGGSPTAAANESRFGPRREA